MNRLKRASWACSLSFLTCSRSFQLWSSSRLSEIDKWNSSVNTNNRRSRCPISPSKSKTYQMTCNLAIGSQCSLHCSGSTFKQFWLKKIQRKEIQIRVQTNTVKEAISSCRILILSISLMARKRLMIRRHLLNSGTITKIFRKLKLTNLGTAKTKMFRLNINKYMNKN